MLPQRDEWSSAATDMGDIVTEEDTRQDQRPAGVEIVPAFALREIDAAVAGLIFRDRARHQAGPNIHWSLMSATLRSVGKSIGKPRSMV